MSGSAASDLTRKGSRFDGSTVGQSLQHTIARNTVFNLVGRTVNVVGWILIAPMMIHTLGSERFGLWSLLTVLSGIYLTLDLGLSSGVTKFVAEFRASRDGASLRGIYTLAVGLYALLSLVIVSAIVLLSGPLLDFFRITPALRPEAQAALIAAAATYGIMNFYMLFAAILGGYQRLDLWNQVSVVVTVIQLAAVALVLSLGGNLPTLMAAMGGGLVAGIVICRLVVKRVAPEVWLDPAGGVPGSWRRLASYGVALQIINIGGLIMFQLDKVLFGRFVSLESAGHYELGYRLAFAAWTLPLFLLPPLLPAFSEIAAEGDQLRIVRLYLRASRYVLAVALPLAFGVMALAPVVFVAWLGGGQQQAAAAAIVLAALLAVNILTGVGSAAVRGTGRPGIEAEYLLMAMVLHIAASLWLIPRNGYSGGLWSLFISGAIASLYFVWRLHRVLKTPLMPFLSGVIARPLLASVVGGVLAWWVSGAGRATLQAWPRSTAFLHLALGCAVMLVVPFAVMMLTRFVSFREIRHLVSLARGNQAVIMAPEEH